MIVELIEMGLAQRASADELLTALKTRAPEAPADDLAGLADVLGPFLRSMPSAIATLSAMTKDPRMGRGAAFAAGQVPLYLVDEHDLLPETELGALGLLDDVYLLHACVARLRSTAPQLPVPPHYAPPDVRTLRTVRSLLPAGVPEALDRTCDALVRVATALFASPANGSAADSTEMPALRIAEAVRLIRQGPAGAGS